MKTILFVVPRFHTNLFFATRALRDAGFAVHVFTNTRATIEDYSDVEPFVFGDAPDAAEVAARWSVVRPDLVFIRNAKTLSRIVTRLARRTGAPALRYDQAPMTRRDSLRRRLARRLRGEPGRRVTPVRGLDRSAPTDPSAIYLPWPVARFHDSPPRDPALAHTNILCVGKLAQPRKNQDKLVEAILKANLSDRVRLTLVGATDSNVTGADQRHVDRLVKFGDLDWITIRKDVPFRDMADLYAAHDVCVLPSVGEPLGSSPIEAMAYGCVPIISTECGSAGYIDHGRNGLLVDMADPDDLSRQIARLLDDAELRQSLRAGVEATVGNELGLERFIDRIQSLFVA